MSEKRCTAELWPDGAYWPSRCSRLALPGQDTCRQHSAAAIEERARKSLARRDARAELCRRRDDVAKQDRERFSAALELARLVSCSWVDIPDKWKELAARAIGEGTP